MQCIDYVDVVVINSWQVYIDGHAVDFTRKLGTLLLFFVNYSFLFLHKNKRIYIKHKQCLQ